MNRTEQIKLERAEQILDEISDGFHQMEAEGKEVPLYLNDWWTKLTDYFQGIYEDVKKPSEG